ncbi:uncharacterized protein LOC118434694 isoform X2 [Folsomia candida]|uniref:Uncharacterized protein n=1 Tax=Folsomia candida TaxID=158441 RepID=A0A226ETW4_FOLCA|nr:uncharacterized protein LOC118434694 isoform X2 [Folsomia candida]OXA60494.1 hypothetical protein Fcan01_04304 [Folsomia candida]
MGNSKHSTVSTSVSLPDQSRPNRFITGGSNKASTRRRKSDPNDYADVQLGRLRSVDFRLGNVLIQSGSGGDMVRTDGLLLDRLWSPNTFVFSRTCEKHHQGFGFNCDISCRKENGEPDGVYVVKQMAKPKRRFIGLEDSPLDIFDVNPTFQRQVLGLVIKKVDTGEKTTVLEGVTVFSIQGVLGHIMVKEDWTNHYEIQNGDGEVFLRAARFNRISGGVEFQIYPAENDADKDQDGPISHNKLCLATLVRLEESKFILKLYAPSSPAAKGLMLSFTLLLMYLMSR